MAILTNIYKISKGKNRIRKHLWLKDYALNIEELYTSSVVYFDLLNPGSLTVYPDPSYPVAKTYDR